MSRLALVTSLVAVLGCTPDNRPTTAVDPYAAEKTAMLSDMYAEMVRMELAIALNAFEDADCEKANEMFRIAETDKRTSPINPADNRELDEYQGAVRGVIFQCLDQGNERE